MTWLDLLPWLMLAAVAGAAAWLSHRGRRSRGASASRFGRRRLFLRRRSARWS